MAVGARRRSKKGVITPDFNVHCARRRELLRPLLQVLEEGRPRLGRPAARHRAVVRRLLLHGRQHARRRQDQQVGDAARPRREERHRSAERGHGPRAVDRVEAGSARARSGTPARRSRSASARAQVSVTPVSMAVYMATLANGGTRVTPHLLKAVDDGQAAGSRCRRRRRSRQIDIKPEKLQAIRDGLWMVVNAGGTGGARADRRATTSPARPARRRSSRTRAALAARGQRQGSARQRLVRVLRAARQPEDRRRRVPRARRARRRTPRRSRTTSSTRSSRSRTAGRCRPPPTHDELRLDYKDPYAAGMATDPRLPVGAIARA